MRFRSALAIGGLLLSLLPVMLPTASAQTQSSMPRSDRKQTLVLANANVREGARSRPVADLRVGHDRQAFVRRLMNRASRVPGVVLLQETFGSARAYVQALNRHPRAKRAGARYRVAVRPSLRSNQHRCGPAKRRRHQAVQTSTIIVNRAKVGRILRRGAVPGWGRWRQINDRSKTVENCAYQPWILLRLRSGGLLRVANVHLAPMNQTLKTRALRRVMDRLGKLQGRTPRAKLVVAGDLNLSRHPLRVSERELTNGKLRPAHRLMRRRGLRDANRTARPRGRNGVLGYVRRIDFIYTTTRASDASYDRCYRGYLGGKACRPSARVFKTHKQFAPCQWRADSGKPRIDCPTSRYRKYYSDHPMLTARLHW